ncbi:MAG: cobaltochelatase subunit CobN, partial [Pseudomonadales bacterium]|nr:cobaltochelatase subunit CobN [Pseudomonadales bacterium]
MHLLAAQPGGFSDDEGIIDLQQNPADIVVLSAADSALAALANSAESLPDDFPTIRLANWMQLIKPAALDLYQDKVLDGAKVVVVSFLGGAGYWQYGFEQLVAWANEAGANNKRTLILVPGDDSVDENLFDASTSTRESAVRVWRYLRQGGALNNQQFFHFLAAEYLDYQTLWHEPESLPHCMMYMPCSSLKHSQASFSDWQQRWQQQNKQTAVCVLLFYRSHLQSANTAMFDELIDLLEVQGLQPLPIAIASLKDPESLILVNALIEQSRAKLIINTTGFSSNTVSSPDLSSEPTHFVSPFKADIPVFQLVLSSSTEDDWNTYSQGLRSRDIAMQVVLPEMDGRIITRAISFKSEAYYSDRCQISVVQYALHKERAEFIAQLAMRFCQLAIKPNQKKRLALMLANYPTKDGRIGNGVGLDTPASTINLLNALAQASYPVANIPQDGTQLIKELLGAVTNNPNTLHDLPCWQSISIDDYWQYFQKMPEENQQAVLSQWGGPEKDPKCRNNRIMLAGIRLGETFVGIQPARGFNMDLMANYHDPDLIPPHSYLAYYFWLRFVYQVDAIVHVGKHGNLEWLPGKGTALSETCWPDIAMGPMPHFYPFIVNDPGEGAQAKRRTQAVIIDHLMPPMARAEVYGELAELENLVDEYYQAMGMDVRREQWLREQIIQQVKETNLLQELPCSIQKNDDEMLSELDTYLCEIKEAQIRHGLHILGQLPANHKLAETLVALLRLPRGQGAKNAGLLHNIAKDLSLLLEGQAFNPLAAKVDKWTGGKPLILQSVSQELWRSEADTRERLELLALEWVESYVIQEKNMGAEFIQRYPCTAEQLNYAKTVLKKALDKSVEQEIQALLKGLNGRFVEPGPSGAPTRGRLDTLPTGRNFFSVDNRSIPSPAAWAIGKKSAQALIERHLQEHGDYPKSLGLSVWGTATMRTGGDDIAQAFYLMGIKPIWAQGSQRV